MTEPTPDFATIRSWYENSLSDLMFRIDRDNTKPEHLEAFGLLSNVYMLAIQTRNSDLMAANDAHGRRMDEERREYFERESSALERIAAALEVLARKEVNRK